MTDDAKRNGGGCFCHVLDDEQTCLVCKRREAGVPEPGWVW